MDSSWRAFFAVICILACGPASAGSFDVTAGLSVTASGRTTAAISASAFGDSPLDNRVHLEPVGTISWLDSRDTRDDDLNHAVFLAAGGLRIVSAKRHWFVSEQLAATSARTGALSSRFEFMTSAGWQDGNFIVLLRHISNAHLVGGGPNMGETMVLVGTLF